MSNSSLVLDSIKLLPEQLIDGYLSKISLPKSYKNIDKIIVSGMGGSNLGAHILSSVLEHELKIPLLINADYEIPACVDRNTLFIASSYSGNTEETIAAYKEARKQKAKLLILTADNKSELAKLAEKDKNPLVLFSIKNNPSDQPRYGLPSAVAALLHIIYLTGAIKNQGNELKTIIKHLDNWGNGLLPSKSNNTANKLAHQLIAHNILIMTGGFLAGSAHTLRNQFNENSKNFACYLILPELNHYALEGLEKPSGKNLACLCFESTLYSPTVQKRLKLTTTVMKKNEVTVIKHKLKGKNKLEQALEMLQLGAWITYYLAELNGVDPIAIPWVDWFKKELK
jgi:glucose/mannose-6-phosphate isomerase